MKGSGNKNALKLEGSSPSKGKRGDKDGVPTRTGDAVTVVKKVRIEGLPILFPIVEATTNFHQCQMAWCGYVMRQLGETEIFIDDDE